MINKYHFIMKKGYFAVLVGFSILLPFLIISPNPFGNSPDVIVDESYFLSSALASIEHKTLPGFDFSPSGAYYGGVQTYLVTAAAAAALAVILGVTGSVSATKLYVATHIGSLTHLVRVVNGLVVVLGLWLLLWWTYRKTSREFFWKAVLFVVLILGNSLFMSMVHTGKVWVIQMAAETAAAFLVILREGGYIKRGYVLGLLTLTVAAASQTVTGIFTGIWLVYGFYLKHFSLKELWAKIKIFTPFAILAGVLQISVFYRGWHIANRISSTLTNINGTAFKDEQGLDWFKRIAWPIQVAFESQPFLVIGFVILCGYWLVFRRSNFIKNRMLHIGIFHSFFILTVFHALFGLGFLYRLVLPLTIAFSISLVLLLPAEKFWRVGALSFALILAIFVTFHTERLWWQPASERQLTAVVLSEYNNPNIAIFVRTPRFHFPTNTLSLDYLSPKEKTFGRFSYLLEHKEELERVEAFKSLSIKYLSTTTARYGDFKGFKIFELLDGCENLCSERELSIGRCRNVGSEICVNGKAQYPHEVSTIGGLAKAKILGRPFALRQISE